MNNTYKTKQKQEILDYLIANSDKLMSVEEILTGVDVGKTTLYRQLERLCEQGLVRKSFDMTEKQNKFQYLDEDKHCSEHFHLQCLECGTVAHAPQKLSKNFGEKIMNHDGFEADCSSTVIFGRCAKCIKSHGGEK